MIVVKVELWPHGDESQSRTLGIVKITNDGTGNETTGNYQVELSHSDKYFGRPGNWRTGSLIGFNRNQSSFMLLYLALRSALFGIRG